MSLNFFDFAAIGLYFLGLLGFGLLVRRIRGFSDYAVGSREVPMSMIFASLSAAYIGPGYTMGFCSKGFSSGYFFLFVVLAFTVQTLLVGWFLAPRLHNFNRCYSVGDVIGTVYGKSAHVIAGFISTVLCIGLVAIIGKVGGLVLHGATGMPVVAGIFLITGVGVLYSYTGGIKSVIVTEALQFAIFAIVVPLLLLFTVIKSGVDLNEADATGWRLASETFSKTGPIQLLGLVLSFLLGETLIPPYANRALASRSAKVARAGFLGGAAYSVIWFGIVVGLGIVGTGAMPGANPDDVFMGLAAKFLPHGLLGLLVVAIMAIIMSSHESILNAGAVSFTRDIMNVLWPGSSSDSRRLLIARLATLIIGIIASFLAIIAPSIIDGLLIIYSLWAPSVLPILIFALVLPRVPMFAGLPAMVVGGATSVIWQFWLKEPGGIPAVLVGLGANLLMYGVIAFVSRGRRTAA